MKCNEDIRAQSVTLSTPISGLLCPSKPFATRTSSVMVYVALQISMRTKTICKEVVQGLSSKGSIFLGTTLSSGTPSAQSV